MSLDVPGDVFSLCGKAAVLGDEIKETPCIVEASSYMGLERTDYMIQIWYHLNIKQDCQAVYVISRCLIDLPSVVIIIQRKLVTGS